MPVYELDVTDERIVTRCQNCGVQINLALDGIEPTAYVLGLARASVVCETCDAEAEAGRLAAKTARRREARVRESEMPEPLRGLVFSDMYRTEGRERAIDSAIEWSGANPGFGLVLYGPTGSGKTRLAATAAWARLERFPVRWVSVAVLLAQLGAAFSDSGRREAVKTLTGDGCLVLDDFDKVNPSEWARNQLFAALDRRIQAKAPLLVTTNLAPSELRAKFGEPISSRLAGCRVLELRGPDYRMKLGELGVAADDDARTF